MGNKWFVVGLLGICGVLFLGWGFATTFSPRPMTPEKIKKACEDKFAAQGQEEVNRCTMQLLLETLQKSRMDQMDEARRAAQ